MTYSKISITILMLSRLPFKEIPLVLFKSAFKTRNVPICGIADRTLENHLNNVTTACSKLCCTVVNFLSLNAGISARKHPVKTVFHYTLYQTVVIVLLPFEVPPLSSGNFSISSSSNFLISLVSSSTLSSHSLHTGE